MTAGPGRLSTGVNVRAGVQTLYRQVLRKRQHRTVILTERPTASPHPPIFIIGCQRSGTSLMRRVLDSHSRIACPPETHFLLPVLSALSDRRSMLGYESMGFDRAAVVERTRAFAEQFYLDYAAAKGKARWADKTPTYVDCLDALDELFDAKPRYVMVYRHGCDVAYSMATVYGDAIASVTGRQRVGEHAVIREAAAYWADRVGRMQAFEAACPDRVIPVRYEEVTEAPRATLGRLFGALGEPFEDVVLDFNATNHDEGIEDGKVGITTTFRAVHGGYKQWSSEQMRAVLDEAGEALEQLGYEP